MVLPRRPLALVAITAALCLSAVGCASSDSLGGGGGGGDSIVIGSANFSENVTLAYAYGEALKAEGVDVTYKVNIGARAAYFPALERGEIDFLPEYAGSILSYIDDSANEKSGADVAPALDAALPKNLEALDFAPGSDTSALNVLPEFAEQNDLRTIGDLAKLPTVSLAGNPEFETRSDGVPGLARVYGLTNIRFRSINDGGGPATLKALLDGDVQVANIFSTTPSISENDLVTLTDPKSFFASQQVVPIMTRSKVNAAVEKKVDAVSAKITTQTLLDWNTRTGGDEKVDPKTVATDWLKKQGFIT